MSSKEENKNEPTIVLSQKNKEENLNKEIYKKKICLRFI
jgi:hypothetical protein